MTFTYNILLMWLIHTHTRPDNTLLIAAGKISQRNISYNVQLHLETTTECITVRYNHPWTCRLPWAEGCSLPVSSRVDQLGYWSRRGRSFAVVSRQPTLNIRRLCNGRRSVPGFRFSYSFRPSLSIVTLFVKPMTHLKVSCETFRCVIGFIILDSWQYRAREAH